jgi:hypothetical protein
MARAALGWGVRDVAKRAGIAAKLLKLQRTFEKAGIIFIDENDEGSGVRLKKQETSS